MEQLAALMMAHAPGFDIRRADSSRAERIEFGDSISEQLAAAKSSPTAGRRLRRAQQDGFLIRIGQISKFAPRPSWIENCAAKPTHGAPIESWPRDLCRAARQARDLETFADSFQPRENRWPIESFERPNWVNLGTLCFAELHLPWPTTRKLRPKLRAPRRTVSTINHASCSARPRQRIIKLWRPALPSAILAPATSRKARRKSRSAMSAEVSQSVGQSVSWPLGWLKQSAA